jgi:hypothetical protein
MFLQGLVGPQSAQSQAQGTPQTIRLGQLNDIVVSELHGKFYENNYRGNVYSGGMTATALAATTITLTNATTPIIGLWNPTTSTVNLVIIKATLQIAAAPASAGVTGAFVWATSLGNSALTNGLTPLNRKTLANAGSQAKYFTIATTLAGLTNNLVIQHAANFAGLLAVQGSTPTPLVGYVGYEEFDSCLILPPGGVLALLNTTSNTTVSVASAIVWEEVPV